LKEVNPPQFEANTQNTGMQITLENETGKARGRLVLSTGQFMRIGRKAPAELTGGEDPFMSSLHFLIECRGTAPNP
jgi:hypothetical protein